VAGPTHYERLGVPSSAPVDQIRVAYRAVARVNHPDSAGSAAGADMAAVNEAWRVLSDPGRRALYDASLRGPITSTRVGPIRSQPDVDAADPVWVPAPAGGTHGRFPIWPFVMVFVLAVIFIFTAGALSKAPVQQGPDNILTEGSCVIIEANGDAREVDCAGSHDAVVVTVVGFDQICPSNTETRRDRQGRGWACLVDG